MDRGLLNHYSLARPPFETVTDLGDMFHAGSRTELVQRAAQEVLAGCDVLAIKGGRGVGKTSLALILASTLRTGGLTIIQVDGASDDARVRQLTGAAEDAESGSWPRDPSGECGLKRLVLLVDDADAASAAVFNHIWTLVDHHRDGAAKVQLVLLGDVGSWRGLDPPELDHLRRACAACYFLLPFRDEEAEAYLDHKLSRAGRPLPQVMTRAAVSELIEQSQCVPAQLDGLAADALLRGYRRGLGRITLGSLQQTASDEPEAERVRRFPTPGRKAVAASSLVAIGVAAIAVTRWATPTPTREHKPTMAIEEAGVADAIVHPYAEAVGTKSGGSDRVVASRLEQPSIAATASTPASQPRPGPLAALAVPSAASVVSVQVVSSVRLHPRPVLRFLTLPTQTVTQALVDQTAAPEPTKSDQVEPPAASAHPRPGLVETAAAPSAETVVSVQLLSSVRLNPRSVLRFSTLPTQTVAQVLQSQIGAPEQPTAGSNEPPAHSRSGQMAAVALPPPAAVATQIVSSVRLAPKPVVRFSAISTRTTAQVLVAQTPAPDQSAPGRTEPPVAPGVPGPGLVLVAAAGDDMPKLFARVYRGVVPPPYAAVVAANSMPIRPGALVIFPEPPHGWSRR